MKNIFIIGSKGLPAKYGGFESFVDKLTFYKKDKNIKYHVACLSDNEKSFEYNNARCFNVSVKDIGSAKAISYDIKALKMCKKYIEENNLKDSVIYILACRIGPFLKFYKKRLTNEGIKVYVNPDGHEWKRSKWNKIIKVYWKFSERLMVKYSDLLICDSRGIEEYIKEEYKLYNPKTTYISYGAEIEKSVLSDDNQGLVDWYNKNEIIEKSYYLIVGRFVPENNYETIIKEFMLSSTKRDLIIITNVEKNQFYYNLLSKTHFDKDNRIKFVGTVYEKELLKKIRENAFAYIHGHEVGGTNPSLLEALASTPINLLLSVNFNREVGENSAIYFSKDCGSLSTLIEKVDNLSSDDIMRLSIAAKKRIKDCYSWNKIVSEYENIFSNA